MFFDKRDYSYLSKREFHKSIGDTAMLRSYDAAHFVISTTLKHRRLLTLFQKEYRGWHAYVNGTKVRVFKSNMNFMSVMVPAGNSVVRFEYKNPALKIAFFISALTFLVSVFLIGFSFFKKRRAQS